LKNDSHPNCRPFQRFSDVAIATKRAVVVRALVVATIVGPILAMINHGEKILALDISQVDLWKIALTFLVPYSVSTVSSVLSIRNRIADEKNARAVAGTPNRARGAYA